VRANVSLYLLDCQHTIYGVSDKEVNTRMARGRGCNPPPNHSTRPSACTDALITAQRPRIFAFSGGSSKHRLMCDTKQTETDGTKRSSAFFSKSTTFGRAMLLLAHGRINAENLCIRAVQVYSATEQARRICRRAPGVPMRASRRARRSAATLPSGPARAFGASSPALPAAPHRSP
jgi:hypothetical protein